MRARQILYILGGLAVTAAVRGLAHVSPWLMGLFYVVLFLWLKPIIGLRSWWHAVAAGGIATVLNALYPKIFAGGSDHEAVMLNVATVILLIAVTTTLLFREHRRNASG